jgi:diguanylate cyclase
MVIEVAGKKMRHQPQKTHCLGMTPRLDPPLLQLRRGLGFAKRAYKLRCIGLGMGFFLVETVLWSQRFALSREIFVALYCVLWPHIAYTFACRSSDPGKQERRNLYVDDLVGGLVVVAMNFAWLPSTLVLLMFMMNNVATGGLPLLTKGFLVGAAGICLGGILFGFKIETVSSLTAMLACLPMLVVYPLSLGLTSHAIALKLAERSRALRVLNERDSLTGLLNRSTLNRELEISIDTARKDAGRVSVIFIDLDGFKTVNDSLGHRVGDEFLRAIATRLSGTVGPNERVARYGGDEFVVLSTRSTIEEIELLALALINSVNAPLSALGHELFAQMSVGISTWPDHAGDAELLLTKADIAMYAAKTRGRNRSVTFHSSLTLAEHRLDVASYLP